MNEEPKESLTGYEIIVSVLKEWWDKMDDSVVLVRCKDCKYYMGNWYCEAWNNSPGFPAVDDDMFCSLAERRES